MKYLTIALLWLALGQGASQASPARHKKIFGARHGPSLANKKGIIVSHLENGVKAEFGLDPSKIQKVRIETTKNLERLASVKTIIVSPFSRTKQTGEVIAETMLAGGLKMPEIVVDPDAAERYFGAYERKSDSHYPEVWTLDRLDASHSHNGVEPANKVYARGLKVLERSANMEGDVLIVSHGDWLQIMKTGLLGVPLELHRDLLLPHGWQTAEIHLLNSK